jgi:predicted porin
MNKKLIALAVAGACVAPAAMAQTANPVTLYGRVYVNFESVEAKGGAAPLPKRNRVEDRVSLFGIRGTEDLGGGLKAFFQLETPFRPDQNDTTFASRNSAVGLQGGFGSFLLGRWDSPMKITQTAVDPFGDIGLGDITAAALRGGTFSNRLINTVQWWSPSWGGVSLRAAYSANEGKTTTLNPYNFGGSVAYSAGPLYLAYAYEEHRDSIGLTATAGTREKGNAFAARFSVGPARISGQYGEYKRTGSTTNKGYMVGADFTAGKNVILASYQNSKDGGTSGLATGQPECDVWSVGYRYDFTRRTSFIAEYAKVDNKITTTAAGAVVAASSGNCNFGQGALAGVANGQDPQGFSLGFRHVF